MKTELKDRVLWFDGDVEFTPDQLNAYILSGKSLKKGITISELNTEIQQYNKLHPANQINVKKKLNGYDHTWNIPSEYKTINIRKYAFEKLLNEIDDNKSFNEDEIQERIDRVEEEVKLFEIYKMIPVVQTIIYIIDMFNKHNIVWGTGRGSSCSSYILYLIGLHDADSIKYGLDLKEFFR